MIRSTPILGEKEIREKFPNYMQRVNETYRDTFVDDRVTAKTEKRIDPCNVPENLRLLIPAVAFWGESDDGLRCDLVELAPTELLLEVVNMYDEWGEEVDEWLCGPESENTEASDEFIDFCAFSIACDNACTELMIREV